VSGSRTRVTSAVVEDAYRQFRRDSAPLWVWLVISNPLTVIVAFAAVFAVFQLPLPRFSSGGFDPFDFEYNWGVTAIIAFFAYRGRRQLRAMLQGRLRLWEVGGITLIAAAAGTIWEYAYLRIAGLGHPTGPHLWHVPDALFLVTIAPAREELIFQACLQTALQRFGPVSAIVTTTVVFSLYHFTGTELVTGESLEMIGNGMLQRFGGLFAYAIVRQTTKSLGAAILSHAFVNVAVLTTLG
jgi:membrane protease YdiL (CAAX protease family)